MVKKGWLYIASGTEEMFMIDLKKAWTQSLHAVCPLKLPPPGFKLKSPDLSKDGPGLVV
jgi:hypothetical protein